MRLNEVFRHPAIADLVARKLEGPERGTLPESEMQYHEVQYNQLRAELEEAGRTSSLPEAATARAALNDLLARVRLSSRRGSMYTAEITFKLKHGASRHDAESAIWSFLAALLDGGNVVDRRPIPMAAVRDGYRATVNLPERGALASRWHNADVRRKKFALTEVGLKLGPIRTVGRDPDSQVVCSCRRPSALIMVLGDTPLTCGDCSGKVPLYRMSRMRRHGNNHGVRYWAQRYRVLDDLWTDSGVGEQFAYRQLSRHDSDLSKLGRDICGRIENTTGIPTYYYLYRWYARSVASENRRTCPGCGKKWFAGPSGMLSHFHFRCDRCHLVSEIGLDVR